MKSKTNIPDAIRALDMVHADLWVRKEKMEAENRFTDSINKMEVNALLMLVANAMIDLGDTRLKRKDEK